MELHVVLCPNFSVLESRSVLGFVMIPQLDQESLVGEGMALLQKFFCRLKLFQGSSPSDQ